MMFDTRLLIVWCIGCLLWATAPAARDLGWDDLSEQERRLLAPMAGQSADLPALRRERLRAGVRQWSRMSDEQRVLARDRLAQWRDMSPQRQARILALFQRYQSLSPSVQERLKLRHQWFRSLPKEQQQRLRQEWRDATQAREETGDSTSVLPPQSTPGSGVPEQPFVSRVDGPMDLTGRAVASETELNPLPQNHQPEVGDVPVRSGAAQGRGEADVSTALESPGMQNAVEPQRPGEGGPGAAAVDIGPEVLGNPDTGGGPASSPGLSDGPGPPIEAPVSVGPGPDGGGSQSGGSALPVSGQNDGTGAHSGLVDDAGGMLRNLREIPAVQNAGAIGSDNIGIQGIGSGSAGGAVGKQ